MSRSTTSFLIFIYFCCIEYSSQDISHFLPQPPEFRYFQHLHPLIPQQQQQQHVPVAFQPGLTSFYKPPSAASDSQGLYPQHNLPSEIVTSAPVAPVSSSSEFLLPEIVENRNAKDRRKFIPLHKQYLASAPPVAEDDRPNYESPQQGNQQYDPFNGGYVYQKPPTSTTTSTATPPIVVEDSAEFIPPIDKNPIEQVPLATPIQGYNYQVPSTPSTAAADMTFHHPFSTPAPVYLPPLKDQQLSYVQNFNNTMPLRLQVHEMRCSQQPQQKTNGYLRAVLKIDNFLSATPSVDNDSSDNRCEVKLHKSYLVIDIAAEDFTRCGVQQCDTDLCLRLRFPVVRGIRTGSDNILTLHCKPQSRVAFKTHALKVGVANDVQARSFGTYAKGGTQNSFRTHVELLRKTAQGDARHLTTNEPVQLGEDLLLRAHVIAGDGWNYTKLSDVSLQRISAAGEIVNSVQLITTQGCLNPSMKEVCVQMPTFDAPLGHKLPFKAIMFQGMRSGEELIMSMRITGCLEYHDCYVNIEKCNDFDTSNLRRRRRDMITTAPHNNKEASEISKISFKVVIPEEKMSTFNDYSPERLVVGTKALILVGSLGFVALLMCLGCFALNKLRK